MLPSDRATRRRAYSAVARLSAAGGILLLLLGTALTAGGAPPVGSAHPASVGPPPGGGGTIVNLTVNLTDAPAFDPSTLEVPASAGVSLELANHGAFDHSFTLSTVSGHVLSPSLSPQALGAFFAANGSVANVTVAPGATAFVNFSLPTGASAGSSYEFVSVVPFQFQAGMRGFLNVTGAPSGPGLVFEEKATDQFQFLPAALGANPSAFPATIDVQVTNAGSAAHTWTIAAQPNVTLGFGNYSKYFADHPPAASVAFTAGGQTEWANFTVLKPGVYEYICTISGHFANGMYGFLYVGVPVPGNVTPPSTEIVQEGVLLGAGSLLGIGGLFALAGSFSGRFPRRPDGEGGA